MSPLQQPLTRTKVGTREHRMRKGRLGWSVEFGGRYPRNQIKSAVQRVCSFVRQPVSPVALGSTGERRRRPLDAKSCLKLRYRRLEPNRVPVDGIFFYLFWLDLHDTVTCAVRLSGLELDSDRGLEG